MSGNEAVNVRAADTHSQTLDDGGRVLKNEHNLFVGLPAVAAATWVEPRIRCLPRSLAPICRKYIFYLLALFIC